jgi:hypothetical protein
MTLHIEDLPALDALTHLGLDEIAEQLDKESADGFSFSAVDLTKAAKYQEIVEALTDRDGVPGDPLDDESPAAEESIERTLTGSIPTVAPGDRVNETFRLRLIDSGTKYELAYVGWLGTGLVFRADELDELRKLLS